MSRYCIEVSRNGTGVGFKEVECRHDCAFEPIYLSSRVRCAGCSHNKAVIDKELQFDCAKAHQVEACHTLECEGCRYHSKIIYRGF